MIIDLTQTLTDNHQVYPDDESPSLKKYKSTEADGYTDYRLITGMHTGTHIDGPMHLLNDSRHISAMPVSLFIGRGCVLDVEGEKNIGWKDSFSEIIEGKDIVLINTGYGKYSGTEKYLLNNPVIDQSLAEVLICKKIKMIGIDLISPDTYPFHIHKLLLSSGILIAENLVNLDILNILGSFEVIALPLKINADSSPARIIARKR